MNDMTDSNARQEDEYEYEYSEFGWTRRPKAAAVPCVPLPDSKPNNVTVGLITTMTGGHLDTSRAVPAPQSMCLSQAQSTLSTQGEGQAGGDIHQIEYSDICSGPPTDPHVNFFYTPVKCSIMSISPATDPSNSHLDTSIPTIQTTRDLNCPLGDYTVDMCNDPSSSPTDSNYSSLDTSMSSMPSSRELNSPLEGCTFISAQVDVGKDPASPASDTGIDLATDAIEGEMDHINPLLESTEDLLSPSLTTDEEPTTCPTDAIEGEMDDINPLVENTEDLLCLTVTTDEEPITSPTDTTMPLCSLPIGPSADSSLDPTSLSSGIEADNTYPNTNSGIDFLGDLGDCKMGPIGDSGINVTPYTITDFVCDAQCFEIVPKITDGEDETVDSIMEKMISCDSLGLTQTSTNVVFEEPPCQRPPDVGEEPKGISEAQCWTQMDSSSSEEDGQYRHFETQALGQLSETLEPEEPHGHREESTEGECGLSADTSTCTVTQYLKELLTADPDCEAPVEHEAVGYCDTHLGLQNVEHFMMKASEIRGSEGETAEGCITDGAFVPHSLTNSFPNPVTESPPLSESGHWDQSETAQQHAVVGLGDLADVSAGQEGVGLKSEDCDSSNELWLDACQFLAGEVNEESILDEWGHSPMRSSSGASTHHTKESSSPGGAASGKPVSDSAPWGPPVERWSSTDSWVSALSDWAPALSPHPEDPFICETLPEASMAIQDQAVGQSPDGSSHNGQVHTTLPQNLLVPGGHHSTEVREENQANSRGQTSDPVACCCLPPPLEKGTALPSDMGAACDTLSVGDSCIHPSPSDCSCNKLYGENYKHFMDLYRKVPPSLQLPYEGSGQYVKAETSALWEVTEDGVSLPVLSIEEEGERNYGSLNISDYSSRAVPLACGEEEEEEEAAEQNIHSPRLATDTGPLTCGLGQTASPECGSHVEVDKSGLPQFIMPRAPFCHTCLGNSPQQLINCTLPGDHLGRSYTNSHGSIIASLLPPYVRNHLKTHQELPVATEPGQHVTCKLRSPCDTSDTSTSPESSSPAYASSSSDEQAAVAFSCPEKRADQEFLRKTYDFGEECTKQLLATGERFAVSEQERVASLTLDLDCSPYLPHCVVRHDPTANSKSEREQRQSSTMPHRTSKTAEGKGRSRHKEKSGGHHSTTHASKKQENVHPKSQNSSVLAAESCEDGAVTVIETIVITEKITPKAHGKKKKKHHQSASTGKTEAVPLAEVENGAKQKTTNDKVVNIESTVHMDSGAKQKTMGKTDTFEAKLAQRTSKGLDKPVVHVKKDTLISDVSVAPRLLEDSGSKADSKNNIRRATGDKHGVLPIESKLQKLKGTFESRMEGNVVHKKAYSEVVKEKKPPPKQAPQVVEDIQALPVFTDPESVCLRCKFGTIKANSTVTWTKGEAILSQTQRNAGDESQVSLTLLKACSKDLGMYRCLLRNPHGSAFSDFHFTSEVLCELVIPSHTNEAEPTVVEGEEEDVQCAPLLFREEDFLSEQYFGAHQPASIVTEKEHFGEGMHRKAFRTTLRAGMMPVFSPGHPCVLKVHNAISHGAKDSDELMQRNYNLAAEECHVQNTAREYIKAYNNVAKAAESFGDVPEIIPIYLVHRPSNDIPYATLEEELRGDFVKYSVKDGKEINLMRRDSEAGQKCCAFQHWVFTITDGNLLVTDMQGVGMRLTDVGIATGQKGYKGFKGNCATSFIDQFKVLHQCNRYCELLGLSSLQPKPKRTAPPAKPKPQPAPKKKTFGPALKGKS